jgi:Zn ribbon nucleic-acid-binding protein
MPEEDGYPRCPRCGGPCSVVSWEELGLVVFVGQCFRCGFLGKSVRRREEWKSFLEQVFGRVSPRFTPEEETEILRRLFPVPLP